MEELRLVRPAREHVRELQEFRRELLEAGDADAFAGCSRLEKYEDIEEWLEMVYRQEEEREPGKVPSHVYLAIRQSDKRLVGIIDLRHHIDHPILGLWGGHMGYSVRPDERGKGYAREILRLNLENCRLRGMDRVMVTCSRDNAASERTILGCGGVLEKEISVDGEWIKRYWISLKTASARTAPGISSGRIMDGTYSTGIGAGRADAELNIGGDDNGGKTAQHDGSVSHVRG